MKKLRVLIFTAIIACFIAALVGCGAPSLAKPKGLSVNETTITLSWWSVHGAKRYTVSIDGNERNTVGTSLSLENLAAGEYKIKVKACGDGYETSDSAWSDTLRYTREAEPGLTFRLKTSDEYEVTGLGSLSGDIVIPDTYRKKPVTGIGDGAFSRKAKLTGVTMGNNVTSIGAEAFYNCSYLTHVTIPESVTSIGKQAFMGCNRLAGEIVIPDGVTEIKANTFTYCNAITGVTIGKGVKTIAENAFTDCKLLQKIDIPAGVTAIGAYAFSGCNSATELTIGDGVETIGNYAFYGCTKLVNAKIGSSVKTIGQEAFEFCSSLPQITIPDNVTSIGVSAFNGCVKLESATIGNGVAEMGEGAFNSTAIWNGADGMVYVGNWFVGFKDKEKAEAQTELPAEDFASGLVGIGGGAFRTCKNLIAVILPDSVRYVNREAFSGCSSLSVAVLGSGTESLGAYAFKGCRQLDRLFLGSWDREGNEGQGALKDSRLTKIGQNAFENCTALKAIEIPDSVTEIESYAFIGTGIWLNSESNDFVYADDWVVGFNLTASVGMTGPAEIKDGARAVSNYAFYKNEYLSLVSVPDSVTSIGRGAFYGCIEMLGVILPDSLEEIKDYTFYKCEQLTLGALPAELQKIGRSAFYGCRLLGTQEGDDYLQNITFIIPDSVTEIGAYAFYGIGLEIPAEQQEQLGLSDYVGIDTMVIGDGVTKIGVNAFANSASLKNVVIGRNVTELGERAFYNDVRLQNVTFGLNLTALPARTFYGCTALEEIYIPAQIKEIGNYAFYNCTALKSVVFAEGVERIGTSAFYKAALETLVLPDSLSYIGRMAFRGCEHLTGVVIDGVDEIDAHAFYGCPDVTFYATGAQAEEKWNKSWNSSSRPVVWGVTVNDGYVVSVTKGEISNLFEKTVVSAPCRKGYTFVGWAAEQNSGQVIYSADEIGKAEKGEVLYAVWAVKGTDEPAAE